MLRLYQLTPVYGGDFPAFIVQFELDGETAGFLEVEVDKEQSESLEQMIDRALQEVKSFLSDAAK
jgi:hypothetical protein